MRLEIAWLYLLSGAALLACDGAQRAQAGTDLSQEQLEVVGAVEQLFAGMRLRDTALLSQALDPDAPLVAVREVEGGSRVTRTTAAAFVAAIAASDDTVSERIWDPEVRIDGDVAALWAPYELRRGTEFSHCGHDAFHLVRRDGSWLIVAITYTVRRSSCDSAGVP